jgi:hypothetical protein
VITALVLYDLPAHIDREACRRHFLKIAPDFLEVPGFIRKQFICDVNGGVAGGSYIWESLAAAKAFYNGPWLGGNQGPVRMRAAGDLFRNLRDRRPCHRLCGSSARTVRDGRRGE